MKAEAKKKNLMDTSEEEDNGKSGVHQDLSLERIANEFKRKYNVLSPEQEEEEISD